MERPRCLQQYAEQNQVYAEVEGGVDFAPLAKDEEGEDDSKSTVQVFD